MKRTVIAPKVYQDEQKGFWARPTIGRRRTWRKLKATKLEPARREAAQDWEAKTSTFTALAGDYLKNNCPNRRLESRPARFCQIERTRLKFVTAWFGRYDPAEIKMPLVLRYREWRLRKITKNSGERTVDLDLVTLSNVLNYGVSAGSVEFNYIRAGRPRFRRTVDVQHSRERAPADANEIHRILDQLFNDARSETCGWLASFHYLTGCRTSELLRLRMDARLGEAGYVEANHLWLGRRSKSGVNPFVLVGPELRDCLKCHRAWHKARYPRNPFYFPTRLAGATDPLDAGALQHALIRVSRQFKIEPSRTPHGLRSYYVTKRRSDGASDEQVAAEIGDKTVSLIRSTYGDLPPNWTGGKKLAWVPDKREPAWKVV